MHPHHDSPESTALAADIGTESKPVGQWNRWADVIRAGHLEGFVGFLLEAGKPLAFLSAQFLYAGAPLFGARIQPLAQLLESDEDLAAFTSLLSDDSVGPPTQHRQLP